MTQSAKQFFASKRVGQLIAKHSKELVYLRTSSTAGDALLGLAKNNVLSEPVLDKEGEYAGAVSVGDLLKSFFHIMDEHDPQWFEKVSELNAEEMVMLGNHFCDQPVEKLKHAGELWLLEADCLSTLLDAMTETLRVQDPHVHHRIYVCSAAHNEEVKRSADGTVASYRIRRGSDHNDQATGLKVHGVVSQGDLMKLVWENKEVLGDIAQQTVEQLELDAGAVFTIHDNHTALEALGQMARDHKNGLGVVDKENRLVGNISASDLRGLTAEEFPLLLLSVPEFLLAKTGKGPVSKAEFLAGKRLENATEELKKQIPVTTISQSTTLGSIIETMVSAHKHRLYVADAEGKAVSVVTMSDVLRLLTK